MENYNPFQLAAFSAYIFSLLMTRLLLMAHLNDAPDRPSKIHNSPKASAGGLAIIFGIGAAIYMLNQTSFKPDTNFIIYMLPIACLFGFIGFIDDALNINTKLRLAFGIAAASLIWFSPYSLSELNFGYFTINIGKIIGFIGLVIWIIICVNTTNFMDGANGLSIGTSAIALIGIGAILYLHNDYKLALFAIICAFASFGFLTYNVTKGNIFAGDTGSWFIGAIYGLISVYAVSFKISPFIVALIFLPIIGDSLITILHRLKLKENILEPHKTHIYQLLIAKGNSHIKTASFYWLFAIITNITAIIVYNYWIEGAAIVFIGFVLALYLISRKIRSN